MSDKISDPKRDDAFTTHDEHADADILRLLSLPIQYDNDKITRSTYVFGAALLASFGGFSFGYGKHRDTAS